MRAAIVGCGPKGLFALERLLAHTSAARGEELAIDVFEPHPAPGAGPVYDPGQPGYLRMNFSSAQIDMWWRGDGPEVDCRHDDFRSWRSSSIDDYAPRAEVGRYLADGLSLLLRNTPPGASVTLVDGAVTSIGRAATGGWSLGVADEASRDYDEILLTTGHEPLRPEAMTADTDWVPAGGTVAVRGFALTFIDAALAMTEGRGGSFPADLERPGRLLYCAAPGTVKRIHPYSRTGRPMLAKPSPGADPMGEQQRASQRSRIEGIATPVADLSAGLLSTLANLAPTALRDEVSSWLQLASTGGLPNSNDPAAEIRHSLEGGSEAETADPRTWLAGMWRAVYPAIVAKFGTDGLADDQWPTFRRLSAEMERLAFGPPPVNAAKLLALIDAGVVDLTTLNESPDGVEIVDAVLPAPGVPEGAGLTGDLVRAGFARVPPGRRGLEISASCECIGGDGEASYGLSAFGRPTEDWVIGNDTLSRSLHPQIDAWAARVATAKVPA